MSTKRSIFYLHGLEHWSEENVDPRDTVAVEFDAASIEEVDTSNGVTVYVKAESQLGKLLSDSEVKAVLDKVSERLNAEAAQRYAQLT